jgi:gamma-glutamyl-gamma-aminobutyrate hydrolase PuuD
MSISTPALKEYVRKVYRYCDDNEITRDDYLDQLADLAIAAMEDGKIISGSSGNGTTINYEMFYGWTPTRMLEVINCVRDNTSLDTVDLALAEIIPIRHVSNDFARMSK